MFDLLKLNIEAVTCVGDIHGNFGSIIQLVKSYDIRDTLIVFCGDVGIGFHKNDYYEQVFKKLNRELSKRNVYLYFIRGNHDDPVAYEGNQFKGKHVRTIRDYSIIECYGLGDTDMTGEKYTMLAVGGGLSVDRTDRIAETEVAAYKYMRFHHGVDYDEAYRRCPQEYWIGEMPVFDPEILNEIKESGIKIDCVCTHTAPHFCQLLTKDGIQHWLYVDKNLEKDLETERNTMTDIYNKLLVDGHPVEKWVYGHFHVHYTQNIDGIMFYLLDRERNGHIDHVTVKIFG